MVFSRAFCFNESDDGRETVLLRYRGSFRGFVSKFVMLMCKEPSLNKYVKRFYNMEDDVYELGMFGSRGVALHSFLITDLCISKDWNIEYSGKRYALDRCVVLGKEKRGIKVSFDREAVEGLLLFINFFDYCRLLKENDEGVKDLGTHYWDLVCADDPIGRNAECVYLIPIKVKEV